MAKVLKIILEKINIQQYLQENRNTLNRQEVLVMNYDDVIFGDETIFPQFTPKEENVEFEIGYGIQETSAENRELKVEYQELCDIDTKENILQNFQVENNVNTIEEQNEEPQEADTDKKLICYHCGFRAKKKHHLACHIQFAHKNGKAGPVSFDCQYCMYKTKYRTSLGYHTATFHMDEVQQNGSADNKQKKSSYDIQGTNPMDHCTLDKVKGYNCNYCSHTSPTKVLISRHIVIHIVNKTEVLQCAECPKKFTEKALQVHMQKVHNPDGIFTCPKCQYTTKWKPNLRRHLKLNDNKETCAPVQKRKSTVQTENQLKGKKAKADSIK